MAGSREQERPAAPVRAELDKTLRAAQRWRQKVRAATREAEALTAELRSFVEASRAWTAPRRQAYAEPAKRAAGDEIEARGAMAP
jgi:hypothetical protein